MSFTTYAQRHLCHFAISLLALSLFLLQPAAAFSQDENTATPTPTGPEIDRAALVALYNATNGDNWYSNTNWLSDEPMSGWYGVTTNADGRVNDLYLWGINLSGTLPAELGNLALVERLGFERNNLVGPIPPEIGNLRHLTWFTANENQLSGAIPAELANLTNFAVVDLVGNDLTCMPQAVREAWSSSSWFFVDNDLATCVDEPTATATNTATFTPLPSDTPTFTRRPETVTPTNTDSRRDRNGPPRYHRIRRRSRRPLPTPRLQRPRLIRVSRLIALRWWRCTTRPMAPTGLQTRIG